VKSRPPTAAKIMKRTAVHHKKQYKNLNKNDLSLALLGLIWMFVMSWLTFLMTHGKGDISVSINIDYNQSLLVLTRFRVSPTFAIRHK